MITERNATNLFARDCIATALIALMQQKAYEEITITDIAKKAGVSRVTYYRNYSSKEDIIVKYLEEHGYQFFQQINHLNIVEDMEEIFVKFFQLWKSDSDFLLVLYKENLSSLLLDHFNKPISTLAKSTKEKYGAHYAVGSLFNLVYEWVKGGMKESVEEMASIVCELLRTPLVEYKEMNC